MRQIGNRKNLDERERDAGFSDPNQSSRYCGALVSRRHCCRPGSRRGSITNLGNDPRSYYLDVFFCVFFLTTMESPRLRWRRPQDFCSREILESTIGKLAVGRPHDPRRGCGGKQWEKSGAILLGTSVLLSTKRENLSCHSLRKQTRVSETPPAIGDVACALDDATHASTKTVKKEHLV